MKKICIAMSCDEWYPYIDIEEIEDDLDVSFYKRVAYMDYDEFVKYKGLLLQMEKLQSILGKLYDKAPKTPSKTL